MRRSLMLGAALIVIGGCGDSTGPTNNEFCTASDATGTIAVGQTRSETLSEADCILPNDARGDGWELIITETTVVQVSLTSDAFDAVVVITDDEFNVIASDDDSGGGTNTSLITSLSPGTYRVWASSFGEGLGDYDLTVAVAQAPTCVVEAPTGSVTPGVAVAGELDATDCLMLNGTVAERWELVVDETQSVRIDLRSTVFDTYLYISAAEGSFIAADDDGGDGVNSRIDITFEPGTYLLWASSFVPSAGAFALNVTATAAPAGSASSGSRTETLPVKRTFTRDASKVR